MAAGPAHGGPGRPHPKATPWPCLIGIPKVLGASSVPAPLNSKTYASRTFLSTCHLFFHMGRGMWAWGLDSVPETKQRRWPSEGCPGTAGFWATRGSASTWVTPHHTECKGASIKGFATNISWRKWASSKGLKGWEFKKWSYNTSVPNLLKP